MLGHGGGFPGFMTLVSFMPEAGIGVAVVVNEGSIGGRLFEQVAAWSMTGGWRWKTAPPPRPWPRWRIWSRRCGNASPRTSRSGPSGEWTLSRPLPEYAGIYFSELWGTATVTLEEDGLHLAAGNLHCVGEPFTRPETMRVELIPGRGMVVQFEPRSGPVDTLVVDGDTYVRVR